jgi:hypothetical protein
MKKRGIEEKPHLKKKNTKSHPGLPGSWVDRVWLGRCTDHSFGKLRLVQLPGLELIHRANLDLITIV